MTTLQKTGDLRTFVPAKDFAVSRAFYAELGGTEEWASDDLALFRLGSSSFYLQDFYVKAWAENLMLMLFVTDVDRLWEELSALNLPDRYKGVRWKEPRDYSWGLREVHLIGPAGELWHFAQPVG